MNRTERLFAITVLLQTKKRVRAKELAQIFEVSERTIYRDMTGLNESGIPIVSLPGEGYELVEGFVLPPVQFTPAEARAIFLSTRMLSAHTQGSLNTNTQSALAKITFLLPEDTRGYVEQLAEGLQFFIPQRRFDIDDPRLALLQQAIRDRRAVWIRYHSFSRNEVTEREVEPDNLTYSNGAWYLNGFCRLRQAPRAFRLSRIEELILLKRTFKPRTVFPPAVELQIVRVRFVPGVARWVRERQHFAFAEEVELADGKGTLMTYRVDDLEEMKAWLLSWGASAEVLEPAELREMVLQEAKNLIQLLT
jgi:predicted DNA-binding transcriptional regulator YafY